MILDASVGSVGKADELHGEGLLGLEFAEGGRLVADVIVAAEMFYGFPPTFRWCGNLNGVVEAPVETVGGSDELHGMGWRRSGSSAES